MESSFLDITETVNEGLKHLQEHFLQRCENVPNVELFYELEMDIYREQRFGENPRYVARYDKDIELSEYYNMGWDAGESGYSEDLPVKLYHNDKDVLTKIEQKYNGKKIKKDYFERLNVVAQSEYVQGVIHVFFYHWLSENFERFKMEKENGNGNMVDRNIGTPLLKWDCAANVLPTLFYDLLEKGVIKWNGKGEGAKMEIARMIKNYFVDKNDNQLSLAYILNTLKPNTVKSKQKIDISPIIKRTIKKR